MRDLFAPVSRDERQAEAVTKWLQSKGKGTIIACTGFGKTRVAINCIKKVLIEHSDVPETLLNWLIKSVQENVSLEYENYKSSKF